MGEWTGERVSEGGTSSPLLPLHPSVFSGLPVPGRSPQNIVLQFLQGETAGSSEGWDPLVAAGSTATVQSSSPRQPPLLLRPSLPSPLQRSRLHRLHLLEEKEEEEKEEKKMMKEGE